MSRSSATQLQQDSPRGLAAPALRAFFGIAARWGLSVAQQRRCSAARPLHLLQVEEGAGREPAA